MTFTSIVLEINLITTINVLILLYILRYYYKYFTRKSRIPSPFPLPIIGNLHQIGLNPAQYAKDNHKKYGDMFEVWVGSKRTVILCHPSLLDQVYVTNSQTKFFPRGAVNHVKLNGLHHGNELEKLLCNQ
ncbi:p450-domain-containing protein [Rhizophagus irregularis]|uniref:p450-domain-containing protein n=1 Tax=Rhizophagus irregularis TaxID=588596 RepID=A0A2I1HDU2_9GLOM|nr:p450-domain-containing protein [Rhizophagus irregularis]